MKKRKISYYLNKVNWYSTYVDCFSRIILEMKMGGECNFLPCDFANMTTILEKYSRLLRKYYMELETTLEFEK